MIKYNFVCDLEFTALDPMRGQIIECALLVIDAVTLEVVNEFYCQVRPEQINALTWTQRAQDVHKITPQQAMAFTHSRRDFCFALLNFLAPYYFECLEPQPFVCHSLDKGFMGKENFSWPYIDFHFLDWAFRYENLELSFWKIINQGRLLSTITMAREFGLFARNKITDVNGKVSNRKSYKLNLLCPLVGFVLDHHKAMADAYGCLAIMRHCRQNEGVLA